MDRCLPKCCGSEDGDLFYGVDPAKSGSSTMIEMWKCNTCGVITITSMVQIDATDRSTPLSNR